MKQIKAFICGLIFGSIGITTVFAAPIIKSAVFNSNKIIFDGKELNLSSQPMISITKNNETNISNYMPVRTVLEQMGYNVSWDNDSNTIFINSSQENKTIYSIPEKNEILFYSGYENIIPDFENINKGSFKYSSSYGEGGLWHTYDRTDKNNDTVEQKYKEYADLLIKYGFKFSGKEENPFIPPLDYYKKDNLLIMISYSNSDKIQICIIKKS